MTKFYKSASIEKLSSNTLLDIIKNLEGELKYQALEILVHRLSKMPMSREQWSEKSRQKLADSMTKSWAKRKNAENGYAHRAAEFVNGVKCTSCNKIFLRKGWLAKHMIHVHKARQMQPLLEDVVVSK